MSSKKRRIRKLNRSIRRRGQRGPRFESLEHRHLLSGVSLTDDGIVEVFGTDESDQIAAYVEEERFVVEINGALTSFHNADVDGLYVEAQGGDDSVKIGANVLQPTLVFGGAGNDHIQGGSGGDVVVGGSGDDEIFAGASGDIVLGDGPNSLDEVPVPQPGEPTVKVRMPKPTIGDIAAVDNSDADTDPLAFHRYLSRISGINAGSDTIVAGSGNDLVFAGARDDSVEGDGPHTYAVATNEIHFPSGNDYIEGGSGNDKVDAGHGENIVLGGSGDDHLASGSRRDILFGGDGNDIIRAGAGNDIVLGDGPNTINQVISYEDNQIVPDAKKYYLANSALGSGNDYVEAGFGHDTVYAGATTDGGANLVFGGHGNDRLYGGRGRDAIVGGTGHDIIRSGAAADLVLGDGPNSLAQVPRPVATEPTEVDLRSDHGMVADIAPTSAADAGPFAVYRYLSRISQIHSGRDTIIAGTGDDLVFAGSNNDSVKGDGPNVYPPAIEPQILPRGDDYIEAGRGNDKVDAGYGANIVLGGAGTDVLSSGKGNDIVLGGLGRDTISTHGGDDRVLGDGPNNIRQVHSDITTDIHEANSLLGHGGDIIDSGAGNDTVYAGRGNDSVFAGAGDDLVRGGQGSDLVVGGQGADSLFGGSQNDTIITGGPNFRPPVNGFRRTIDAVISDVYITTDRSDDFVDAGDGHDRIFAFGGHEFVFGGSGRDEIHAGNGNDILVGGDGHDRIFAGAGDDVAMGDGPNSLSDAILPMDPNSFTDDLSWREALLSNSQLGRGCDMIDGGEGNDRMFGGQFNDRIFGRTGDDLLHGGHGNDRLFDDLASGGGGTDVFVGDCGADTIFANDGPGGPVDFIFYDIDDTLHVDGEDELIAHDACDDE